MKWHRKHTAFGICDDEGRRVAVIVQDHPNEAMNSRLIESAPQLLKAAETLAWSMRDHIKDHPTQEWAALVDAICDAIGFDPAQPPAEDDPAWTTAPGHPDIAAETARAATARRNEECQTNNAPPSA